MLRYEADGSAFTIGLWQQANGRCEWERACVRASLAMDSCPTPRTHPLGTRLTTSALDSSNVGQRSKREEWNSFAAIT